jgi:glycosyltransferase involved in cell wall biosynthesis
LACKDIVVHGFVEDIENMLSTMRINVAPLRYGAGTKGKVVQALSNGLPTIGTNIAFEGMNMTNLMSDLVADIPFDFAQAVSKIYLCSESWNNASRSGLKIAKNNFGIEALKYNISNLLLM